MTATEARPPTARVVPAHSYERRTPTLVGREAELDLLADRLRTPGGLVLLEGEAGVGKSRLVAEALRITPSIRALAGQCQPLRNPFPLGPVVDALRLVPALDADSLSPITGALRPLIPELSHMLPETPQPLGDPHAERHRLYRAIFEVLRCARSVVLVLEDLHWADDLTIEFLHAALSLMPPSCGLIVTFRGEEALQSQVLSDFLGRAHAHPRAVRLALAPLSVDGVSRMVMGLLDAADVSKDFARYLHDKTSGLPFAVEETLRYLVEHGAVARVADGEWTRESLAHLGVPPLLRDATLARLAKLSPETVTLLRMCAVLGSATDGTLAHATGRKQRQIARALTEAVQASILRWDAGTSEFRHALLRDAIYESIPQPARPALHRRAAAALDRLDPVPLQALVHHLRAAGDREGFARVALTCGKAARTMGDSRGALALLRDVIEARTRDPSERLRAITEFAGAALEGLVHEEPVAILGRVADDPTETRQIRGASRIFRGWLMSQAGDEQRGHEELKRGIRDAAGNPHHPLALATLGMPRWDEVPASEHRRYMARAVRAVERTDGSTAVSVTLDRISVLLSHGDASAWHLFDELPMASSEPNVRSTLTRGFMNIVLNSHALGYTQRADELLLVSETWMAETPEAFVRYRTMIAIERAVLDLALGHWDGLHERATHLVDEAVSLPWIRTAAEFVRLTLSAAQGSASPAEHDRSILEAAHRSGYLFASFSVAACLSGYLVDHGRPAEARAICETERDMIRRKLVWAIGAQVVPPLVRAQVAEGSLEEARATVAELGRALDGLDSPAGAAFLALSRACLHEAEGAPERAAAAYRAAAAAFASSPRVYEALRARADAGRCALQSGGAGDELASALAGFEQLGAAQDARRARSTLRGFGVRVPQPWRGGRRGYGSELSPREREVAGLVAEGLTNREIAERLFMSEKTVERHVSAALRKFAVDSRRALARMVP